MIESATGIILRTRPLTETSLIVNWLTAEHGRISTVAKGARKPKSPFAGRLDLFFEASFTYRRSRRSELHTLCELELQETHAALRNDLGWLQQAAYATRLSEQTTERETPVPGVQALLRGLLHHLPEQPPQPRTVYAFELKLLVELGLQPNLEESTLSAPTQQLAVALTESDWHALPALQATLAQVKELRQFLHGFLIYHLGRIPKHRPV
ncbi:MAG TPA: DNA repair protein RecO [Verrucomicrobiota bacterium]|nr:DNA repair protein RecO [Verrucomicrobiota bacterium]HNT13883.1 DNA repair protein RecO [Verrucomicrobiota bacterium]